jgi:hypothetical protein
MTITGITPPNWLHSHITLLYKKNDPTAMVAAFIKRRWTPLQSSQKQLRWFTSTLTADPTSTNDISTYADLETNSVHVNIDIQKNDTGFVSPTLQGKTFPDAKALLTLGTLATQYAHATRERDINAIRLDRVARALNFPEIRKLLLQHFAKTPPTPSP